MRVIIKLKNNDHINISGDAIDIRDGFVMAWNGDFLVAVVASDMVSSAHLS